MDSKVADVIKAFRNNTLQIKSGGGGKYGEIVLPEESQNSTLNLFM